MQITAVGARHAYEIGEEVVVRLDGAEPFEVESGAPLTPVPQWTIAEITGKVARDGDRPGYALRFRQGVAMCICVIDEDAIDGTA